VHLCDNEYDNGPILVQRTCPVLEDDTPDTLAARVFEQECLAYPEALRMLADGRVIQDRTRNRVRIIRSAPEGVAADAVARAAWYAEQAHAGQTRDQQPDGKPYASHVEGVAAILCEHGVTDATILAAAYLHDVVEKTPVTGHQVRWVFGTGVAGLVDELTLPHDAVMTGDKKHAALMAEATRLSDAARLIKLADRLDNARHKRATLSAAAWRDYARDTGELLQALKPWPNRKLAEAVAAACAATT
jgi:(p)ppGpp synthase/HD superfamily hydrolase